MKMRRNDNCYSSVSYIIIERCSFDCFDVESALHDEEDSKRNIIYELILRDLSKDTDDYDCGPVPEISEFLQLTNAPLWWVYRIISVIIGVL
jgi:hypothetical protein